jgi:hypothetical protein
MNRTGKYIFGVVLFLACFAVYSGMIFGKINKTPDNLNYFKDLALSFTQGRLDIKECPPSTNCYDIVQYKGKIFMYQPPAPALIYIALVKIWGRGTPDPLINAFAGALNSALVFFILLLLAKKTGCNPGFSWICLLSVFWAFGTVQFYMSMLGSVWYIAQVFGQMFLLLSILLLLIGSSLPLLLSSGIFFGLAVFTKNDLVFYLIFMAGLAYILYKEKNSGQRRSAVPTKEIAVFMAAFVLFGIASLIYNAARFDGNMLENGIKYHNMNSAFTDNFNKFGYLSPAYVPHNILTEVFMPPKFIGVPPFFEFSKYGFGFLWASPLFLLAFVSLAVFFSRGKTKNVVLISATFMSFFLISGLIFLIMGNGWDQFASRYSLDYQFLMIILMISAILKWEKSLIFKVFFMILLFVSLYMNYNGVKYFIF